MSNKDVLLTALKFEEAKRTPWVPYVGVHAAKLIDKPADEYLCSADLIYDGVMRSIQEYNPDGIPIVFDLQLEAEAFGCELLWAKDNPPAVSGHILDHKQLSELQPIKESDGRLPIIMEATEKLVKSCGNDIGLMGLVCGTFTLGLHLMGSRIINSMVKKPDEVFQVMNFCSKVCKDMCKMYLDRGIDIVAIVDPMTSQISPQFFDKYVAPSYDESIEVIKSYNAHSLLFVCGNATRIVPNLAQLETDGFAVDENIDFQYVADTARANKKAFAGNLPLTVGLLFGTVEENVEYAKECIEIGKGPGFILAPGCDMPYHTNPENVKAVVDVVYGKR
jgi:MtaA/CmuA family methyltransferase